MIKRLYFALLLKVILGILLYLPTIALPEDSFDRQSVPEALQDWIPWVLHERQSETCPFYYNQFPSAVYQQKSSLAPICYWPSYLELKVTNQQGQFRQVWQVYAPGWLSLPGDKDYWPQQVKLNGKLALVADSQEIPMVYVTAGEFILEGQFSWEERPKFLSIPFQTGLVKLTIDDKLVDIPQLDEQGRLWFNQSVLETNENKLANEKNLVIENRLDLKVYRRVIDDIPLQVVTQIDLEVAGQQREVLLGPVILAKQLVAYVCKFDRDHGL